MKYSNKPRSRFPRRLLIAGVMLLLLIVAAAGVVRHVYNQNLRPVSSSQQTVIITIPTGSSVKEISALLSDAGVIRNNWVFEWYVHSHELSNRLRAGTYAFSPSQPLNEIVDTLAVGEVTTRLVTIIPGRRIDQVRADLINDGFPVNDVDLALDISQYSDLPVMGYVPRDTTTLEGLLFPDSYQRTEDTTASEVVKRSLEEMGKYLTPTLQQKFASRGLTVYQGIILASMIEREVANEQDRPQVAQVFLSRLQKDMTLGSDVTAIYGAIKDGAEPSVRHDSAYSTSRNKGLPPTPISTISESSLNAAANPAATDWLYFVSGDDGTTHFSKTLPEHEANTNRYCTKLCGN